jgi:hypothetical protein
MESYCHICFQQDTICETIKCGHIFHKKCLEQADTNYCPYCTKTYRNKKKQPIGYVPHLFLLLDATDILIGWYMEIKFLQIAGVIKIIASIAPSLFKKFIFFTFWDIGTYCSYQTLILYLFGLIFSIYNLLVEGLTLLTVYLFFTTILTSFSPFIVSIILSQSW